MAIKRIDVEVLKSKAALDAFTETWRRVEANDHVTPRLAFASLHDLFSALTEKRLELMRFVASREGLNTNQLARELERDYKNVHTDVAALVELGLLEKDNHGALTAPFDEIVIHAGIRDAA
ncbi:MAG: transcriptional regulator [Gammaproteobacteria bacterium]|nr:transcriptional regulator [Gammaproteobacteria bacterium]